MKNSTTLSVGSELYQVCANKRVAHVTTPDKAITIGSGSGTKNHTDEDKDHLYAAYAYTADCKSGCLAYSTDNIYDMARFAIKLFGDEFMQQWVYTSSLTNLD
jgi:hypothetical protein